MPSGIATGIGIFLAFVATSQLNNYHLLPLWACILIGVAIFGIGIYLEFKHGYIELG